MDSEAEAVRRYYANWDHQQLVEELVAKRMEAALLQAAADDLGRQFNRLSDKLRECGFNPMHFSQ